MYWCSFVSPSDFLLMIRKNIHRLILGALVTNSCAIAICAPAHTYTPNAPPRSIPLQHLAQATIDTAAIETSVFQQVNEFRTSQSLPALTRDSVIDHQARIYSQNMANGVTPFGHYGLVQRVQAIGLPYKAVAENIAKNRGYHYPANKAVKSWLASSNHLNNIRGQYKLTGVGVATNSKGEVFLTQIFMR